MDYKKRIVDDELDLKLESFGATLIVGPKGCGKTTSAKQKAKSVVEFQDEEQRENLLDDDYEVPAYYVIDKYLPYSVAARFPKDQCDSKHVLIDACLAKGAILHRFINGGGDACSAIYYGSRGIWWHYRENEARMIKDWNAWCPV